MKNSKRTLTIGWLYPSLMSTYGDRGNILILTKRSAWRNIETNVISLDPSAAPKQFENIDLFFGGGAQDLEQTIVMKDLQSQKADILKNRIEDSVPALFVCGAPQLMGEWYEPGSGERITGVGIFDMTTTHPGNNKPRLIGNILARIMPETGIGASNNPEYIVGFENHGGRTTLGPKSKPLAKVLIGHGNNGADKTEGVMYKNALGTYLHGPLLSKNPHIADWLIKKALEKKYQEEIILKPLDDSLETQAQKTIAKRLGIDI